LTAQGRLSGLIIGLLPIVVGFVVYLINPLYIYPLFSAPIGNAMLGFAIFIEIIGAMFIRKIVNINV
jgi:tight adherence protein B